MSALCMVHQFFFTRCCHFVKQIVLLDIIDKLGGCPWFAVYAGFLLALYVHFQQNICEKSSCFLVTGLSMSRYVGYTGVFWLTVVTYILTNTLGLFCFIRVVVERSMSVLCCVRRYLFDHFLYQLLVLPMICQITIFL